MKILSIGYSPVSGGTIDVKCNGKLIGVATSDSMARLIASKHAVAVNGREMSKPVLARAMDLIARLEREVGG